MNSEIIRHYDALLRHDNDPVLDPQPLKEYMDLWDGQAFIDHMQLNQDKAVLEIGVGTGRLAVRVAPKCGAFCGVDMAPQTIARAQEHLAQWRHAHLLCGDFMTIALPERFDVIYSSLTFMHILEKQAAIQKVANLLTEGGRFLLSIDKNQAEQIDAGVSRIAVYPDNPQQMKEYMEAAGLRIVQQYETEFAHIFVCEK